MTIDTVVARNNYVGNDVATVFAYEFKILDDEDLRVTQRDDEDVETLLTLGIDYTVTGAGEDDGGNVILTDALPTDYLLTIRRVVDLVQETDIRNQGEYFPELHEDTFDYARMVDLQQQDEIDRSLKFPETEDGDTDLATLPPLEDRKNHVLGFDNDGRPIAVVELEDSVLATAYIETLLDDADAPTARETLGVDPPGLSDLVGTTISPSSIGANQNNYAGLASSYHLTYGRLTSSAHYNLTGLEAPGLVGVPAQELVIINIGSNNITLVHQSSSSDAANRMILLGSADLTLEPSDWVRLVYDVTSDRWRQVA